MGMTDRQFISFRKLELEKYELMLKIAGATNADPELIALITKAIEQAKADIEG
jgi:hypothetical protein